MSTGQLPSDPLTQLNGPMGHGILTNAFNPFADMGLNPNDPNMMQGMLDNPLFLQVRLRRLPVSWRGADGHWNRSK